MMGQTTGEINLNEPALSDVECLKCLIEGFLKYQREL